MKKGEVATISKKTKVYQANVLTEGRYDFNLIEKRIMYGILVKCREKFIDNQKEGKEDGQKDLFNDLVVYLPIADLMKSETNTNRVYDAAVKMRSKNIEVRDGKGFLVTGFINYAKHEMGSTVLEIGVSKHIIPQIVELTGRYTCFELTVAITLKSVYTQRFYELCNQWKNLGYAEYDVSALRAMLFCEDKFKTFGEFKRGVLDMAQKELKTSYDEGICDVYFTWEVHTKTVNLVEKIKIKVFNKNAKLVPAYTPEDLHYFIKTQLTQYFPTNKGFVKRVLGKCQEDFSIAEQMQQKITKICLKYTVQERPAVLKHVIDMDFDIV